MAVATNLTFGYILHILHYSYFDIRNPDYSTPTYIQNIIVISNIKIVRRINVKKTFTFPAKRYLCAMEIVKGE